MSCDSADRRDPPELSSGQPAVSDDDMVAFRAVLGANLPVAAAVDALTRCGGDTERAIKWLLNNGAADRDGGDVESGNGAAPVPAPRGVKAEPGIGDAAYPPNPLPPVKIEAAREVKVDVKTEPIDVHPDEEEVKVKVASGEEEVKVKVEASGEEEAKVEASGEVEAKVESPGEAEVKVKTVPIEAGGPAVRRVKEEEEADEVDVKDEEEPPLDSPIKGEVLSPRRVKEDESDCSEGEVEMVDPAPRSKKRPYEEDGVVFIDLTTFHPAPYLNPKPIRAMPPRGAIPTNEWRMVVAPPPAELDECPPDRREWCFFKKSYATGLSTCRGRKLLDGGEVVHFAFPSYDRIHGGLRVSYRQAAALAEIVRFSTNRSGELGKLSPVWAKCLAPLVNSSTIMVQGKIVFPMMELRLMQEVLLYVSFYVHRSSMCVIAPENANHPDNPLRGLFKLLRRFGVPDV